MRLLVTRPEPDATRTAEILRARGHEVLVAPLLSTQRINADLAGPYGAVLMTSANAARAIAAHARAAELRTLPTYVVGSRTAEAVREAGFARAESADGALTELVQLVATRFAGGPAPLLYLAAEDRAGDLAGELSARGIAVETAVVYRAVASERLPPELVQAFLNQQLDGALHYSRRSVATMIELSRSAGVLSAVRDLAHYCVSEQVSVPLREAGATRISVASRPVEAALIGML